MNRYPHTIVAHPNGQPTNERVSKHRSYAAACKALTWTQNQGYEHLCFECGTLLELRAEDECGSTMTMRESYVL